MLVVDDNDLTLQARWIYVAGSLLVGGRECPLETSFSITLWGPVSDEPFLFSAGSKVLAAVGSQAVIEMYGGLDARAPVFTRLASSVSTGDRIILLEDTPVGWKVGDAVLISSSDYQEEFSEERTISAIDGAAITLNEALAFPHYGVRAELVDERAYVALLSRNVRIMSDETDSAAMEARFGGHTFFLGGRIVLDAVEFKGLGQAGHLARYPVHFHTAGDMVSSRVGRCSIRDTFQRCVTIHLTNGVHIHDNVAFRSSGHCYFLEDGYESRNRFERNLAAVVRNVEEGLEIEPSDNFGASCFWITFPDNDFVDNVAIGGTFGYWFALFAHPSGLGVSAYRDKTVWGRYRAAGVFRGNTALSARADGLFVDLFPDRDGNIEVQGSSYGPTYHNVEALGQSVIESTSASALEGYVVQPAAPATTLWEDFTAFKNRNHGIWIRGDDHVITGCRLASNRIGMTLPGTGNVVHDCIIVGDTDNRGLAVLDEEGDRSRPNPLNPRAEMLGYRHYDAAGPDFSYDVRFYSFAADETPVGIRPAAAVGWLGNRNVMSPHNRLYRSSLAVGVNAFWNHVDLDEPVPENGALNAVHLDADGTLTSVCGAWVVAPSPHLYDPHFCQHVPAWNAYRCIGTEYTLGRFSIQDNAASTENTAIPISVTDGHELDGYVQRDDGGRVKARVESSEPYETPQGTFADAVFRFAVIVQVQREYRLEMPGGRQPSTFRISLDTASRGDFIRVAIPYPFGTVVDGVADGILGAGYESVASKDALGPFSYYFDSSSSPSVLWIQLQSSLNLFQWLHGIPSFGGLVTAVGRVRCPADNCQLGETPLPVEAVAMGDYSNGRLLPRSDGLASPRMAACELFGIPGGELQFAESGPSERIIDDDGALVDGWAVLPENILTTSSLLYRPDTRAARVTVEQEGTVVFVHLGGSLPLPGGQVENLFLSFNALLELDETDDLYAARDGSRPGDVPFDIPAGTLFFAMVDTEFENIAGATLADVNSPFFSALNGPLQDREWREVHIPLSLDLAVSARDVDTLDVDNLGALLLISTIPRRLLLHLDNLRLTVGTRAYAPIPYDFGAGLPGGSGLSPSIAQHLGPSLAVTFVLSVLTLFV